MNIMPEQPNVTKLRPPPDIEPVPVPQPPELEVSFLRLINTAMSVLSLRLLAVIALLGAVAMFGVTIYNPVEWRLYTAIGYAIVVLLPVIWLYVKRSD